jgi:predicted phage terminase large subunit-like protein
VFPISGRVVIRKAGECLDSRRWPAKEIAKRQKNRLVWAGQFQQEPAPVEGNLIRVDDVRYHSGRDPATGQPDASLPTSFDSKLITVDCTFKDLRTSDRVAILVVGTKGPKRFVLNIVNEHLDLDGTERAILSQHALFGPISAVLIEDAALGAAAAAHLKERVSGVILRSAAGGKMSRTMASAPSWQAGNWYLDRTAHWTNEFVNQITIFPNYRADDLLDASTQCEVWLQESNYTYGVVEMGMRELRAAAEKTTAWFQRLRAPKQAPADAVAPLPHCPKCGSADCERYGSEPGARIHCHRCGAYSYPSVLAPAPCGHDVNLQVVLGGGGVRCGQCGNVVWPGGPPTVKRWSRRDLPPQGGWRN